MKKQIITITVLFFSLLVNYKIQAQCTVPWCTLGNAPGNNLFGTTNQKDIEIIGHNHQIGYISGGNNGTEGDFDIGYIGSYPLNKLLVENGAIYNTVGNPTPYAGLSNIIGNFTYQVCIDPAEMGIFSASNQASNNCGNNLGIIGLADEQNLALSGTENIGEIGIGNGEGSDNAGGFFYGYGADPNSYGALNDGVVGYAEGDGALRNEGGHFGAYGGLTNTGVSGVIFGTGVGGSSGNYGVVGNLSSLTGITPGSVPYYAIYGLAPLSSGTSGTLVNGTNADDVYAGYFDGDVFCSSTYYYSDSKLKENITAYTGALDKLNQLNVKSYAFRQKEFPSMNFPQGPQVGVLAEDIKNVFPNLVKESTQPEIRDNTGKKVLHAAVNFEAVNYDALIPVLVQATKEVDAKTAAITPLASTVAQQQAQIEQLLAQSNNQMQQINSQSVQIAELRNIIDDICNVGCAGLQGSTTPPVTPQDVALYQSIPNPTTGVCTIGYLINAPFTTAYINVTSVNGGAVQQFKITQGGKGSVVFDGSHYAGGTFNYTLYVDDKAYDTKTIVLVKN